MRKEQTIIQVILNKCFFPDQKSETEEVKLFFDESVAIRMSVHF